MALDYNNLTASTREHVIPKLYDNIFATNTLTKRAMAQGRMKSPAAGEQCHFRVQYAKTTAAGTFTDHSVLETAPNEFQTRGVLDWGGLYATMSISIQEERKNKSPEAIGNLWEEKVDNAKETLADNLGTGLFSKGTDSNGLAGMRLGVCHSTIAAAEGVSATYAGIARGTYTWFNANYLKDTTNYSATNMYSTATGGVSYTMMYVLKKLWNSCMVSAGGGKPTVHVTSRSMYECYEDWALSKGRIPMAGVGTASDSLRTDLGFEEFTYKGAPILVDSHCPVNYWYMLNENRIFLQPLGESGFAMTEIKQPTNQIVSVAQVFWLGQLILTEPRSCGVLIASSTDFSY